MRQLIVFLMGLLLAGCSAAYFDTMEKLGYPKRELLVERIESARESQAAARDQFRSALDRFRTVVNLSGGKLETEYNELRNELDRSESRAKAVHSRIASVEDVAGALFEEWEQELKQYKNEHLRRQSAQTLEQTRNRYVEMMRLMKRAESKLEPALQPLRDNVLFLKHNLNAQAIGSLDTEVRNVESSVEALLQDLEDSMSEADRFVTEMNRRTAEDTL